MCSLSERKISSLGLLFSPNIGVNTSIKSVLLLLLQKDFINLLDSITVGKNSALMGLGLIDTKEMAGRY